MMAACGLKLGSRKKIEQALRAISANTKSAAIAQLNAQVAQVEGGSAPLPARPADAAPSSSHVTPAIAPGARVELHGLQKAPELNGKSGVVERWDERQGRWQVRVDGDPKPRGLRSGNLSVS